VAVSGALDLVGRSLSKIAQDLRLLGSGPEAGLGELRLPAVQPGSSIMPGKVNPVIPEFVIQVGFQVAGQYTACVMALDHGELDLNVWESVVVFNVLDAIDLLVGAVTALDRRCLEGLEIDREVNHRHAGALSAVLTEFGRIHGYSAATRLLREAGGDRQRIQELLDRQAASAD
jgi:aspartate ammonia-lyase